MYAKEINYYRKFEHDIIGVTIDSPNTEIYLITYKDGIVSEVHTNGFSAPFTNSGTMYNIALPETMQLLLGKLIYGVDRRTTVVEQVIYTAFTELVRELFKKQ